MRNTLIISALVLGAIPPVALAHEGYLLDEAMAHLSREPLLMLTVALAAGALVGAALFLVKHNATLAFRAGAVSGAALALVFFTLANPASPQEPLAAKDRLLAGAVATVYKSASCGCCSGYIEELKRQGAAVAVEVVDDKRLAEIKTEHGVPEQLSSCHTSVIDGYVVEGHVPIEAVAKLRAERPAVKGIALPGMPSGTPGMPGPKFGPYEVKDLSGGEFMRI